jgi:uncharacterized protein (TIGR03435 family)
MISDNLLPLANHLWQSTLFAAAVWLLTLVLRKDRAALRHRLWLAASLKFMIPFSLLVGIGDYFSWRTGPATAPPRISVVVETIGQPFQPFQASTRIAIDPKPAEQTQSNMMPAILEGLWFCGFVASLWWWFVRWNRVRRVVARAIPLNLDVPIRVRTCQQHLEPGVFGIFKPVLLLPEGITERLLPEQMQSVIAHELCHVRRRDNMASAIHLLVEALFWFHPLVWWIKVRLIDEQERACDEEVLRLGGDPQVYAESILKVCEIYLTSLLICVSGITGSNLKKRIEDIMRNQVARKLSFSRLLLLASAAITALAGPILIGTTHAKSSRPQTESTDVPTLSVAQPLPAVRPEAAPIVVVAEAQPPSPKPAAPRVEPEAARVALRQNSTAGSDTLDVITIRPSVPDPYAPPGARGGLVTNAGARGNGGRGGGLGIGPGGCKGGPPTFDENRMTLNNNSLYTLITWAYGSNCLNVNALNMLEGGDEWVRSDQWVIQAIVPQTAGIQLPPARALDPPFTDPKLQSMLQRLLADRFQLALHRETKDVAAYALVVAKGGAKLSHDASSTPPPPGTPGIRMGPNGTLSALANFLTLMMRRPIIDRTGITEGFPINLFFTSINLGSQGNPQSSPSITTALEEQLGLTLEDTRTAVDVLVIDRVERPVQN